MCGIVSYAGTNYSLDEIKTHVDKIQYRGPDNSHYESVSRNIYFIFHRLAIVGLTDDGNQPMKHPEDDSITLICNGEIYNYQQLAEKYGFNLHSGSDCEVILFMYKKFGIEKTIQELDGVFMFVLYDELKNELLSGRDPMGVRPGFVGRKDEDIFISSEAKPLTDLCDSIIPFEPGTWWSSKDPKTFNRYFTYSTPINSIVDDNDICASIRHHLTSAVNKRLMSDREIGCLLSGGLDSSLITGLVAKEYNGRGLNTFSIGMEGSVDLVYAKEVADFLGTKHHQIELTQKDFLKAIETVIYNIESYDTTTVRASVGNYLVSKYISENSDCKVIFNGDGADEVCCGYVYLKNAPSPGALQIESERLVKEIYLFDVLRSDRSISSNGLEARTPFLDKAFVKYYLSIHPELKQFDGEKRLEKYLLRKAFEGMGVIPDSVLWRRKCAFSDGVSSQKTSWHTIVQSFVDQQISDEEFSKEIKLIKHCTPVLKESYYYRKVYKSFFGKHDNLIPKFWMPQWTDVIDPSARELSGYKE
ncbi:MAG: asparagine synthase B [Candidatus Marinimicrobia bacterium]|jgi:asparagine synthase (glutamine-hydrolysing)|nr:asparagine synthase B [Candidatus Neomarinimicrobiota bacterium]MBT3937432.1 asparagine synthase B [Candidatus Neomarinimicrobiota bacterium]MBT3961288.1 asparagine synthase B [Candidatus Neomarinimicrobiota bacterium]MBT4383083.1 asparagine synthase B [Candidatus Neomarinimicrobiota bacterium]MBT4635553.1 asparagine synthase B [Candidatus Neomarinimicrobiota bacterium]